jgi:ankyrin repeat protein
LAVATDHLDVVEQLLKHKPDLNLKNQDGKTAQDLAEELKLDKIVHIIKSQSEPKTNPNGPS